MQRSQRTARTSQIQFSWNVTAAALARHWRGTASICLESWYSGECQCERSEENPDVVMRIRWLRYSNHRSRGRCASSVLKVYECLMYLQEEVGGVVVVRKQVSKFNVDLNIEAHGCQGDAGLSGLSECESAHAKRGRCAYGP